MPTSHPPHRRHALLPTLLLTSILLLTWLIIRCFYAPADAWPTLAPHLFLGWIILLFLLTTTAAILWSAAGPWPPSNILLGHALLIGFAGALLLLIALTRGLSTFADTLPVFLLLITWTAFWSLLTYNLRHYSASFAVVLSLTLSTILFAAPVTAVPLAYASSRWSPSAHEHTLTSIAYATPILPALQALNPSTPDAASWSEWPAIYRLSDTAQEIALRARWPIAALLYAVATLALTAISFLTRRFHRPN